MEIAKDEGEAKDEGPADGFDVLVVLVTVHRLRRAKGR